MCVHGTWLVIVLCICFSLLFDIWLLLSFCRRHPHWFYYSISSSTNSLYTLRYSSLHLKQNITTTNWMRNHWHDPKYIIYLCIKNAGFLCCFFVCFAYFVVFHQSRSTLIISSLCVSFNDACVAFFRRIEMWCVSLYVCVSFFVIFFFFLQVLVLFTMGFDNNGGAKKMSPQIRREANECFCFCSSLSLFG